MKKLVVSTMLLAGVSFGFAKGSPVNIIKEVITIDNIIAEKELIKPDTRIRCISSETTITESDGTSHTASIQYCYEIPDSTVFH